ncbi:hypothetical protein AVEN_173372-1 [Araneus ventricosus]|uniref:Uncharacterized protein n=1 Tax=Araneus ventricosus TaxID=182803 RepID=A0A4Y2NJ33_ARAVE|nr:hypothetical protein AVEN_173372-1 [Araneus ventricosus]
MCTARKQFRKSLYTHKRSYPCPAEASRGNRSHAITARIVRRNPNSRKRPRHNPSQRRYVLSSEWGNSKHTIIIAAREPAYLSYDFPSTYLWYPSMGDKDL